MESLNLRNTLVSFLNVSLKMHADVIAGRQISQTSNEIMKKFMNEYVNPPCNSSLAASNAKCMRATSEGGVAALFIDAEQRRGNIKENPA